MASRQQRDHLKGLGRNENHWKYLLSNKISIILNWFLVIFSFCHAQILQACWNWCTLSIKRRNNAIYPTASKPLQLFFSGKHCVTQLRLFLRLPSQSFKYISLQLLGLHLC